MWQCLFLQSTYKKNNSFSWFCGNVFSDNILRSIKENIMSHAILTTVIFFHSSQVCSPGWVIFFLPFTYEYFWKVSKTLYTIKCQNCFNYIKKKKKKKEKAELISHIVLSGWTKEECQRLIHVWPWASEQVTDKCIKLILQESHKVHYA